jgi:MFS family permease
MSAKPIYYGWILLGVLWLVFAFNLGFPAYGGPAINNVMADAIHMNRASLGLITTFYIIMSGLPGPLVAMAVNRFGSRRTLVAGSLMNVCGALYMALVADDALDAYLGFSLVVGGGVCTGAAIASQTVLSRWFVRRRATAISILYSAGAIGGYFATKHVLPGVMHATNDWRSAWWVIVGLSSLAGVLALLFVKERPEDSGLVPDGDAALVERGAPARARPPFITGTPWEFRDVVRRPSYWLIVSAMLGGSSAFTFFLGHGIAMLKDLGHTQDVGFGALATMTWTGLLAKGIIVLLGNRLDPRYLWVVFNLAFAASMLIIVRADTQWLVTATATCLGIGFGGGIVCLMTVLGNYFGLKAFALLSGIAIAINTTTSAIAPYIAGFLFDRGYPYSGTCYVLAAWALLGALTLLVVRRPPPAMLPAAT